jgi:vancomycin resistance protein YoaR
MRSYAFSHVAQHRDHIDMSPPRVIFAAVPLAIALLPLGIYFADRATSTAEIARNVTVSGVPVGGMNRTDATLAIEAYENTLRTNTGVFSVNGKMFKLSPISVGLEADVRPAIDDAFDVTRSGGPLADFASWLRSFSTTEDIDLDIGFDDAAIEEQIETWETEAIPNPAFSGSVTVKDGVVKSEYPKTGLALNTATAHRQITDEMSTLDKTEVTISVVNSKPKLTDADVDAAALELSLMINEPITMTSSDIGFRTIFSVANLADAARTDISADGSTFTNSFAMIPVLEMLDPRRTEYELEPVDAAFDIDVPTDQFTVVPGRTGTLLDTARLLTNMKDAALGSGQGDFPLLVGEQPAFTTEDAESFTTLGPLAGFTTDHPANQPRVTNIQKMADMVNGAVVLPGDEWSINDHVGERTEAKGYVAAPAIIDGAPYCCDHPANIGGGVSQFGTTLYNAVFYSCLEDVDHKPHSLYFSRYPMGREATLGVPDPDVRFANNTDHPVVIATSYSDTSITVKMYGDNGGITCADDTHDKEDIVEYDRVFIADTAGDLLPGQSKKVRSGIDGFLIKVDRVVTYPDGHTETDLNLVHRYRTLSEQIMVHRCETSGRPINCPVRLTSVVNQTWADALSSLSEVGLLAAKTTSPVDDQAKDGIVIDQNPSSGEWVGAGTTITLTVGVYEE